MPICRVNSKPTKSNPIDTMRPASGPAIAKSNNALLLGGGDFIGVIAPAKPVVADGSIFGTPISN